MNRLSLLILPSHYTLHTKWKSTYLLAINKRYDRSANIY